MATAIIFLVIGLAIGGALGYVLKKTDGGYKRQAEDLSEKNEALVNELGQYKADVANHFIKTADLVNNMTDSYRAVHEHLAEGANVLCAEQLGVERLDIRQTHLLDKHTTQTESELKTESTASEDSNPSADTPQRPVDAAPESVVAQETPADANTKTVH